MPFRFVDSCYKYLCAFCEQNRENQQACYTQRSVFLDHVSINGLCAPDCITAVYKDNATLCSKVSEKLVRKFISAIVKYGKIAKWLLVVKTFLTVNGRPIKRAQDLILKLLREFS